MKFTLRWKITVMSLCIAVFFILVTPLSSPAHAATSKALKAGVITYPAANYVNGSCGGNDVWHTYSDQQGYGEYWSPTTGSDNCTGAVWNLNGYYTDYKYNIWVPSNYANATIGVGFYSGNTRVAVCYLSEWAYTDQWAPLSGCSNLSSISKIVLSSNTGSTGSYIGFGYPQHSLQVVP